MQWQNKLACFENITFAHAIDDGTAYFAKAISYACKMFMKLTPGHT